MIKTRGYAAHDPQSPLVPFDFTRRAPGPRDVYLQIDWCGVCHSDLHQVRNEWKGSNFPIVPGHEIVGRVIAVGAEVTRFKAGDHAGVGCMVNSCRACAACRRGLEQFCERGAIWTYNSKDRDGSNTYGGYSRALVVNEAFVLRMPASITPAAAAPLLCAGITTYSPLRHWRAGPGQRIGVIGLGGLGHMAVKLAHALGAHVVLFTSSENKVADGKKLGADEVVVTGGKTDVRRAAGKLALILDTVSAPHDLNPFLQLLDVDGTLVLLGVPDTDPTIAGFGLIGGRRRLAGSLIGGIEETQEMLDFCDANEVAAEVEVIAMAQINEAYERMLRSDVKYRFVIDLSTLS